MNDKRWPLNTAMMYGIQRRSDIACSQESNLGTGLRKLAGSFVITTEADPSLIPNQTQQDSRKHHFSVLNWLRNVIKCTLNYISEPIKYTKTSVFCYAVKFCSGWDQLLCVMTKLPASLRCPAPRFDFLCPVWDLIMTVSSDSMFVMLIVSYCNLYKAYTDTIWKMVLLKVGA